MQELASVGTGGCGNPCRPSFADNAAAVFSAFGAEIDNPIRVANHVEIVLYDDDRVAEVGETMQNFKQLAHIVEVQAGGWLIEQIKRAARLAFA